MSVLRADCHRWHVPRHHKCPLTLKLRLSVLTAKVYFFKKIIFYSFLSLHYIAGIWVMLDSVPHVIPTAGMVSWHFLSFLSLHFLLLLANWSQTQSSKDSSLTSSLRAMASPSQPQHEGPLLAAERLSLTRLCTAAPPKPLGAPGCLTTCLFSSFIYVFTCSSPSGPPCHPHSRT